MTNSKELLLIGCRTRPKKKKTKQNFFSESSKGLLTAVAEGSASQTMASLPEIAATGTDELVKASVESGANINDKDGGGFTALAIFSAKGSLSMVRISNFTLFWRSDFLFHRFNHSLC
jgi:ankyrin repeat protein